MRSYDLLSLPQVFSSLHELLMKDLGIKDSLGNPLYEGDRIACYGRQSTSKQRELQADIPTYIGTIRYQPCEFVLQLEPGKDKASTVREWWYGYTLEKMDES